MIVFDLKFYLRKTFLNLKLCDEKLFGLNFRAKMFFSLKIFDLNFFTVKVFDLKFYYEKLKRNTLFIVQIQNHVINKKRILEISKFSKSKLLTTRKFQHIIIHANFRMFCQSSKLPIFKFFKRNYQNSYLNYLHLKFPKKT